MSDKATTSKKNEKQSLATEALSFLASHQSHWLERFAMPLLAVGFSVTSMALARGFITFFAPDAPLPGWLLPLGFILALEGVYLSSLLARTKPPATIRLAEVGAIYLLVYVLIRLTMERPYPIISSSILSDGAVLIPALVLLSGWYLAASAGHQLTTIGNIATELGDRAAATLSWEQQSLLSGYGVDTSRKNVLGWLSRRTLFYTFVAVIFFAISVEAYPQRLASLPVWRWSMTGLLASLVFFGFSLQGLAFLYRMKTIWDTAKVSLPRALPRQWFINTVLSTVAVVLVAILLPANISPISYRYIVYLISLIAAPLTNMSQPVRRHRISPQSGAGKMPRPGTPEVGDPDLLTAIITALYLILLVGGAVFIALVAIGFLLFTFYQSEREKLQGLARLPLIAYLWFRQTVKMLASYFQTGVKWSQAKLASLAKKRQAQRSPGKSRNTRQDDLENLPSAPALFVRRLFALMVRNALRSGYYLRPGQTPAEFTANLEEDLAEAKEEIRLLREKYHEARYSNHHISPEIKPKVKTVWQKVMRLLGKKR